MVNSSWGQPGNRTIKYGEFSKHEEEMFRNATGVGLNRSEQGQMQDPSAINGQPTAEARELAELRQFKQSTLNQGSNVNSVDSYMVKPIEFNTNVPPVNVPATVPLVTPQVNTAIVPPVVEEKPAPLTDNIFKDFFSEGKPPEGTPPKELPPVINTAPAVVNPQYKEAVDKYNTVAEGQNRFLTEMSSHLADKNMNPNGYNLEQVMDRMKDFSADKVLMAIQGDPNAGQMNGTNPPQNNPFMKQPNTTQYTSVTNEPAPNRPVNTTSQYFDTGYNNGAPEI